MWSNDSSRHSTNWHHATSEYYLRSVISFLSIISYRNFFSAIFQSTIVMYNRTLSRHIINILKKLFCAAVYFYKEHDRQLHKAKLVSHELFL